MTYQSIALSLLLALPMTTVSDAEVPENLDRNFTRAVEIGDITGAQVAAVRNGKVVYSGSFGSVEPDSQQAVDDETVFLIGSCSKPFASVCVLSLIADPECDVSLDASIERWLPAFAAMNLSAGGTASRSPTVEELLKHRAGVFSQKIKITPEQARWLYTFDHTLKRSVEEIARFPLLAEPGTRFAYSGAGYCVLGRVAELAAQKEFEVILQESVCHPLGLKRTTYFPNKFLPNATLALGAQRQEAPHQLGADHLFPLIGGSLYSTATEMARFADAVAQEWNNGEQGPLTTGQAGVRKMTQVDSDSGGYGLGWKVILKNGVPSILTHSGSLQSYRAWIALDLESGNSLAACWTLGSKGRPVPVSRWLQRSLSSLQKG